MKNLNKETAKIEWQHTVNIENLAVFMCSGAYSLRIKRVSWVFTRYSIGCIRSYNIITVGEIIFRDNWSESVVQPEAGSLFSCTGFWVKNVWEECIYLRLSVGKVGISSYQNRWCAARVNEKELLQPQVLVTRHKYHGFNRVPFGIISYSMSSTTKIDTGELGFEKVFFEARWIMVSLM